MLKLQTSVIQKFANLVLTSDTFLTFVEYRHQYILMMSYGRNGVLILWKPNWLLDSLFSQTTKRTAIIHIIVLCGKIIWLPRDSPGKEPLIWKALACHDYAHWYVLWRHYEHDCVSTHQPHGCLFNLLFRRRSKKTSNLRVIGLCVGNSPGRGKCFHLMTSSWVCNFLAYIHVLTTSIYHRLDTIRILPVGP